MLGPVDVISDAVGNVHELRAGEGYAAHFGEIKIGIMPSDDWVGLDCFGQFLGGLRSARNDGIGKNFLFIQRVVDCRPGSERPDGS